MFDMFFMKTALTFFTCLMNTYSGYWAFTTNSGKGHLSINFNFVLTAIVKHTSGSILFRLRFHKSNIVLHVNFE